MIARASQIDVPRLWYDFVRQIVHGSLDRCGDASREKSYMLAERLEVRLDSEHRRRLTEIAASRRIPVSEVVRQMIDETYQAIDRAERLRAAQDLISLQIEDVPDPDVLSRQLDETHELPDLY
jgi:hypothetical protein